MSANQILDRGGDWFEKPSSRDEAMEMLRGLRDREHQLVNAVVVAIDGSIEWRHVESVCLVMRPFSDTFPQGYVHRAGDEILGSVGAYRLEGLDAQLFASIDGNYFTILGLPLLPLLEALRVRGVLDA